MWVPCQVIGARGASWEVLVFNSTSIKPPSKSIVATAPLYVLRRAKPKNQPLYLLCDGEPPTAYHRLGNHPVELAFQVPTTFRTSPRAGADQLPVWATWAFAAERVKLDLSPQPNEFRSTVFPGWRTVDPRALRGIDAAVQRFASLKLATETALRKCVLATNKFEAEIHTIEAEQLFDRLLEIATRNKLPRDRATAVIDTTRQW
jgi:hypothetical protein